MRYLVCPILILLFISLGTFAQSQVMISGKLVADDGKALAKKQIAINSQSTTTNNNGEYQLRLPQAQTYTLNAINSGYYDVYQTFSHYELKQRETNFNIAPISLIERKAGRTLLAFGGDVMMGRRYIKPYFNNPVLLSKDSAATDTQKLVEIIKPYMSLADFAAVNLETQIANKTPAERAPKSVTFFSPPETVKALKYAGIDYVTLGNNHTYDYLESGLDSTIHYLNEIGLPYSGAGKNQKSALAPYQVELNENAFSFYGFVGWEGGFTPTQTATNNKGGAALGSEKNMIKAAQDAQVSNQVGVVQYHGSLEYKDEPSLMTEQRLKMAIDNGADLAVAHHPHVAQGFEIYNNKLIAYSMGNFIFDQYFYATNHSFILYVWMDGEHFYRAEVVPIYLKGYVPTPATGLHREQILRRLSQLSSKRATYLHPNGGHAIIATTPNTHSAKAQITFENESIKPLPMNTWHNQVASISNNLRYRLGYNLINGSDFESHNQFNSAERGFNLDTTNFNVITTKDAKSGSHVVATTVKANDNVRLAMTNFTRVYRAGNPMSVSFSAKGNAKVKVYWQGRKTRGKLFDSLKNSPLNLIGEVSLNGGEWQSLALDFNSPRVGFRSIRILLEFEATYESEIMVDDLALIEWRSTFVSPSSQVLLHNGADKATYIGLEKKLNDSVTINFK